MPRSKAQVSELQNLLAPGGSRDACAIRRLDVVRVESEVRWVQRHEPRE